MAYLQHITAALDPQNAAIGKPPVKVTAKIGTPPPGAVAPPQAHVEPPPYDAAMDPGWHGILDPNDHELRNFLGRISPEERQMLLVRLGRTPPTAPIPAAPVVPGA